MFSATALMVAFVWPSVYNKFQKEIDQACGEADKQFKIHYSKIKEQVLKIAAAKGPAKARTPSLYLSISQMLLAFSSHRCLYNLLVSVASK